MHTPGSIPPPIASAEQARASLKFDSQREAEEQRRKVRAEIAEIQAKAFEKAGAYTNLVLIGGYAGAFTIWSNTKANLPGPANIAIALLLGLSLTVFIGWEISQMIIRGQAFRRVAALITQPSTPTEFFERLRAAQAAENLQRVRQITPWVVTLLATASPAIAAIALLFYNFVAALVGWPMWPQPK